MESAQIVTYLSVTKPIEHSVLFFNFIIISDTLLDDDFLTIYDIKAIL